MRRLKKIFGFVFTILFLFGCMSKEVSIYPVSGPVKEKLGNVRFKGIAYDVIGFLEPPMSGKFEVTLENETKCEGNWVVADIKTISEKIESYLTGIVISSYRGFYGSLYGGSSVTSVEEKGALIYGVCSDGRKIEGAVRALVSGASVGGYGAAKDDQGNTYYIIF